MSVWCMYIYGIIFVCVFVCVHEVEFKTILNIVFRAVSSYFGAQTSDQSKWGPHRLFPSIPYAIEYFTSLPLNGLENNEYITDAGYLKWSGISWVWGSPWGREWVGVGWGWFLALWGSPPHPMCQPPLFLGEAMAKAIEWFAELVRLVHYDRNY